MWKWLPVVLLSALLLAACDEDNTATRPEIGFAPLLDTTLSDPDNPRHEFRMDFARVEREFPLTRAELARLTPENLKLLSQEEVDQIYGRLTAGPIPDGPYRGDLFFRKGDSLGTRLGEILGGIRGRIADAKLEALETTGRLIWKGKWFYRDERVLRNFIEDLAVLRPLVGDNTDSIMTATIERRSLLRYVLPDDKVWLLLPAKLYCGQSLLDSRRESVIIDYAYNETLPGYRENPDSLAGRKGMRIRDEIRMIRPGFYLGRAYANRVFLLNFTLYNEEVSDAGQEAFDGGAPVAEDCWPGEQARQASLE